MMSESSPCESPAPAPAPREPGRQRVLLVTGVLGAGKTTALRALEDLGWETIDNFPIRLLERLIDSPEPAPSHHPPLAIGFDARTRGFDPAAITALIGKLTHRWDLAVSLLYLDCAPAEVQRRYNETRRRHPLAADRPAAAGIAAERELMAPLLRLADLVVGTTQFTPQLLTQTIREHFALAEGAGMTVTVLSFGFAKGPPPVADFVFDMRFLDNPHWHDALRAQIGRDADVARFIAKDPAWAPARAQIIALLLTVLPRFRASGKAYVTIGFGCTGGRHRSVFAAEEVATALREAGFSPTVLHRNLGRRSADQAVEEGAS